ncbi:MAG: polyphosphate kinase 1 [Armatimonadota bacterium]|nr:polyphosphate kinase 1 [bacterium]MDW8289336.1 polyphosphate kinase 1 [Armatimonadota bacterium]
MGIWSTRHNSSRYLNRELSLLEFQRRVLEEAEDERNPLLERVKFLAIFGSNMDEFFMVRVSGIREQIEAQLHQVSPDGLTLHEQMAAIRRLSLELYQRALQCFHRQLLPQLRQASIQLLDYDHLTPGQRKQADQYFHEFVYPVLTPLALDPGHPFPHISNLSLNLAVIIRDSKGNERFARVKVPNILPRLVPVKAAARKRAAGEATPSSHCFTWLEQVIAANLDDLFPGMQVVAVHPFRVIRDADIEIRELEADDLLETIQQTLHQRKFGSVVQLATCEEMPTLVRNLLMQNMELYPTDVYTLGHPLGLSDLMQLYESVPRPDLKFTPYRPAVPVELRNLSGDRSIFDAIREHNILLHHPYDSFDPVVEFLRAAARDPQVLAIKQTLYRVGKQAPVVQALLEAAEHGKQVAVLVELKARFDEESNIGWARALEQAGVHVVYGLVGLKTHCKVAMVVRQEGARIRRYVHLSTGNYNATTARIYEDIGMFTCDEDIGADATDLFNYLTGYSNKREYRKLLVAPVNLRQRMRELIQKHIDLAAAGRPAHLIFKMNSLVDTEMIDLLYEASRAGVRVDLLVRGICCLRPGVKDLSENITVTSIVGRYLEHSRIYYFWSPLGEEVYLGSADLMPRNLDHRVEVVFPVERQEHIRYLRDRVLETYLRDNRRARRMMPDGTYQRLFPQNGEPAIDAQETLMRR